MVRMTFRQETVELFKSFFEERKEKIRGFNGCMHLELWQDTIHSNIFYTYSHWHDETALSHYRHSAFFKETWQLTKEMFLAKAEAWSVNQLVVLP